MFLQVIHMATRNITPLTLSQYKALVAGIPTYCPNATFMVAGQTFTSAQAVTYIQNVLNAVAATASARGSWKDAIAAEEKLLATDGATVKAIRSNLAEMFSNAANTLAAFEITPRKPYTPLTAAKRAAASAKARATRIARGTTSKKAKALVTGDVTGVTITPVTSGSAQAAPVATPVVTPAATPVAASPAPAAPAPAAAQASPIATPALAPVPVTPVLAPTPAASPAVPVAGSSAGQGGGGATHS
jgi:hypothetical protein